MEFNEYQARARKFATYPEDCDLYPVLGLTGEAGEVADKIKKIVRAGWKYPAGLTSSQATEIAKELGDVLWYLSELSAQLGYSLGAIAAQNLQKLEGRQERGTLHGDGDNR